MDRPRAGHSSDRVGHVEAVLVLILYCLLNDVHEGLLHALILGRTRLIIRNPAILLAPGLRRLLGDCAIVVHVTLVSHDDERELVCITARVIDESRAPLVQSLEAFFLGDVVDKHAAVGAAIKSIAQRMVLLLTRRVPDLHRDYHIVDQHLLLLEVCADCGLGSVHGRSLGL